MADDELRELERRWRASGALDDGLAWHRARLRAGAVDLAGLRREAAAGDAAAWRATDPPALLIRLDTWLRAHAPDQLAGFHPPATPEQLTAAEAAIGRPLPPLLRALYQWRGGQPPAPFGHGAEQEQEMLGFIPDPPREDVRHLSTFPRGWRLLSLDELVRAYAALHAPEAYWPGDPIPFMVLRRKVTSHVPVHDYRCIDEGGFGTLQEGQILEGGLTGREVTAPSLERWLEVTVAALEQRVWTDGGSGYRYDYFARAVNPGYPLEASTGARPRLAPPPLADRREELWSDFLGCFQGLLVIALLPAACLSPWLVSAYGGPDGVAGFILNLLLLIPAAVVLAGLFVGGTYLYETVRHEHYTAEFADATLAPQDPE